MRVLFTDDVSLALTFGGREYTITHRAGEEADVPDALARLLSERGLAVRRVLPERALARGGEVR